MLEEVMCSLQNREDFPDFTVLPEVPLRETSGSP